MVKYAPGSIKEHIHMSGLSRRSYRELRHGIDAYLLARRVWTKEGTTRWDRGSVEAEGDGVDGGRALRQRQREVQRRRKGECEREGFAPKGQGEREKAKAHPRARWTGKDPFHQRGRIPVKRKEERCSWQGADGSAKGTRFEGYCSTCWMWGHIRPEIAGKEKTCQGKRPSGGGAREVSRSRSGPLSTHRTYYATL